MLRSEYKNRPPGNICGHECVTSPWAWSSVVNGDAVPPESPTWNKPPDSRSPNTIRPSADQAPPWNAPGVSERLDNVPCKRSNARNLPPAEKAIDLLSGDQNGAMAPVVPGRRWACVASSDRTHIPRLESTFATKAVVWLSGDTAKPPPKAPAGTKRPPSGGWS